MFEIELKIDPMLLVFEKLVYMLLTFIFFIQVMAIIQMWHKCVYPFVHFEPSMLYFFSKYSLFCKGMKVFFFKLQIFHSYIRKERNHYITNFSVFFFVSNPFFGLLASSSPKSGIRNEKKMWNQLFGPTLNIFVKSRKKIRNPWPLGLRTVIFSAFVN